MGGDYSREAIILNNLNISVTEGRLLEGGDYFKYFRQRWAIIRGRRLIKGRLLFEESLSKHMKMIFFCSQYGRKYNSWGWVRLALTVLLDVTTPVKFNIL